MAKARWLALASTLVVSVGCGSSSGPTSAACTPKVPTDETYPSSLADWCQVSIQQGQVTPLASDVVPFTLTTPLFSDGATKRRTVHLPPGTSAVYDPTAAFGSGGREGEKSRIRTRRTADDLASGAPPA